MVNLKIVHESAEMARAGYLKTKRDDKLIAWFRAEIALNYRASRVHGHHDDDILQNHLPQVEVVANALRDSRLSGHEADAPDLAIVRVV